MTESVCTPDKLQEKTLIYNNKSKTTVLIDHYSRRLRLLKSKDMEIAILTKKLDEISKENSLGKIIVYALAEEVDSWLKEGYSQEGVINKFYMGKDNVILTKYLDNQRAVEDAENYDKVINKVEGKEETSKTHTLPRGFTLRIATQQDAQDISELAKLVFESYPSPIYDPRYVQKNIKEQVVIYVVITDPSDQIVAVASAEINQLWKNAELTDCATHPDYRGYGLISIIIKELIEILKIEQYICIFSLARASSIPMNLSLKRLGFKYYGRLKNNCYISGNWESMNIWCL